MSATNFARSENGGNSNRGSRSSRGYWSEIYVRKGEAWKIRMSAFNGSPSAVSIQLGEHSLYERCFCLRVRLSIQTERLREAQL